VEVAGYFLLTPWAAARRVLGISVIGTLLAGRQAVRTCRTPGRQRLVRAVGALGVALGLLFQAIDINNAAAERDAVNVITEWVRDRDPAGTIWFLGHWGLQHYGERAGWRPVVPDESRLTAGSWLVVPERAFGHQNIDIPPQAVPAVTVTITSRWPLSTIPWYHGSNKALNRQSGPILTLTVYHINSDCIPCTPAARLADR
jgi:hypothetical protein